LSLATPAAGIYTYDDRTTVSGIADDDVLVDSVTVNGIAVTTTSTGNAAKPHEVSFSVPFDLAKGPNKITVVATDSAGKVAQDTRYVYRDSGAPTLSFTPATSTTPNGSVTVNGTATDDNQVTRVWVNGLEVPFSSSGNVADPNEVAFTTTVNLVDGPNNIAVTVTDNCKRTTAETHVVTKADKDTTAPVFGTIADVSLEQATPQGTAHTLAKPAVTDDRDPAPVVTSDAPAVFLPGETVVTWTATDASGNKATAFQKVTVSDTKAPVVVAPANVTAEFAGSDPALYAIGSATVSDAADAAPVLVNDLPASLALGVTTITWTATDAAGNQAAAVQTLTLVDTTAPAIAAPADVLLEQLNAAGTPWVLEAPAVTDAADAAVVISSDAPAVFPAGVTVVTWTAKDASGNTSTVTQKVTVKDSTAPAIQAPADLSAEQTSPEGAAVALGSAIAVDAVSAVVVSNDAPAIFPAGVTVVTWTATDAAGNSAAATQKVTVKDTVAPVIGALDALVLEQVSAAGTAATLSAPGVSDAADAAPVLTNDAPAIFPAGVTVVNWTAKDKAGNVSTASQTVTVRDTVAPTLSAPADIVAEQTSPQGAVVSLGAARASDVNPILVTNNAPAIFPAGVTVVTWTATDAAGNSATATQKVTVSDTTAPAFPVLADVNVEQTGPCGAVYTLTKPAVSDAADPAPVVTSNAPATYRPGTTVVTWTAVDKAGNVSTATQKVIVRDTKAPVLIINACPSVMVDYDGKRCGDRYGYGDGMVPVFVYWSARDAIDGNLSRYVELVSVSSDEPADKRQKDILIVKNNLILVRCQADQQKDGRVYTLKYQVEDKAGNVTVATKQIEVRLKAKTPAVDSGVAYEVTPEYRWWEHYRVRNHEGRYEPCHER
jgi:hypothetical protein